MIDNLFLTRVLKALLTVLRCVNIAPFCCCHRLYLAIGIKSVIKI